MYMLSMHVLNLLDQAFADFDSDEFSYSDELLKNLVLVLRTVVKDTKSILYFYRGFIFIFG